MPKVDVPAKEVKESILEAPKVDLTPLEIPELTPIEKDTMIVIVRDPNGFFLFRFNARTNCIEIRQREKPNPAGGKFPANVYAIDVKKLMNIAAANFFKPEPVTDVEAAMIEAKEGDFPEKEGDFSESLTSKTS